MARIAIGADEKKKLMVLGGLLAAIVLVVGVLYFPRGSSTSEEIADAPPPSALPPDPAGIGSTPGGAAPAAGGSGAAPGGITAASLVSVERYRNDPFEPFPLPPPLPTPPPPPPPPPPVMIPPPIEIVSPDEFGGGSGAGGVFLPPMGINRRNSRPISQLPPIIPRRVATAPTAPRLFSPPGGQGSGGSVILSQNKRLSGVIIGDSVRALLEVTSGGTTTTRVVQPGDEVDGIRILRLERVTEGGRTITRLVVRENNQEQFVELRPAPQASGDGTLGIGGMPGDPGMMPGMAPF